MVTILKIIQEYLPEGKERAKVPADLGEFKTLDKRFSVHSNPGFLMEVAAICIEARCYYDLAVTCLKDYITSLTYYKEFNRNVDLALEKKKVIIMLTRCLTHLDDVPMAQRFFDEVEVSARQDYLQRKTNG